MLTEIYTIKWIYRINTQWDDIVQIRSNSTCVCVCCVYVCVCACVCVWMCACVRPRSCLYVPLPTNLWTSWNSVRHSSPSSSSCNYHGAGPPVDLFRSHASRSVLNGLPWFLLPYSTTLWHLHNFEHVNFLTSKNAKYRYSSCLAHCCVLVFAIYSAHILCRFNRDSFVRCVIPVVLVHGLACRNKFWCKIAHENIDWH